MRRAAVLLVSVAAAGVGLAGCTAGARESEARTAQRSFQVGPFQSISLTGSPDVVVTVGGQLSVRAEGDARLVERLEITVQNGDLRIGYRDDHSWSWGWSRDRHVTIHVTVPALAAATLTGSGDMRIDRIQGERFAATATGSGDLTIGQLQAREAAFALTGSGGVRAAGRAENANIQLQGSGDVDLGGLETRTAMVSLHGSGDVTARAMESAQVSLFGSGDVSITGPARCQIEKRGSGDVRCGNQG